jgi:N-acetylmuramoyl-L-alanine amidase
MVHWQERRRPGHLPSMRTDIKPRSRRRLVGAVLFLTLAVASVTRAQNLRFQFENKTGELKPREHDDISYYSLRETAGLFSLPYQERSEGEFLLRGPRGSVTLFAGKPEIRVNGETLNLNRPVWRRRGNDWYVAVDFFDRVLPRILGSQLTRGSGTTYDVTPIRDVDVKVSVATFPDHTRLILETGQPADFQVRDTGGAVEITTPGRRLQATLPAEFPPQGFAARLSFDSSGNGLLRIEKGPSFQGHREQTLDGPPRRLIDFYGAPPIPPPPPVLPSPARTELPTLPATPAPAAINVIPDVETRTFVPRPTKDIIVLDAGHGGPDLGVHPSMELLEKNLTAALAQLVRREIEGQGRFKVVVTRESDTAMGLLQRTAIANAFHAEAFVSLHFGGSYDPTARGPVVYYHAMAQPPAGAGDGQAPGSGGGVLTPWESAQAPATPRSQVLAAHLQSRLNALFSTPDTRVSSNRFGVLEGSVSPAVIVEAGHLTNAEDAAFLSDPNNLRKVARAIGSALMEFLK